MPIVSSGCGPGPWTDPPWKGWSGDNPPCHAPVFVLTHHPSDLLQMQGGTTFIFVTDGIESALEQAKEAAGDRDVLVGGGAHVIPPYLAAGLVDDFELSAVPLLVGSGARLLENVGDVKPRCPTFIMPAPFPDAAQPLDGFIARSPTAASRHRGDRTIDVIGGLVTDVLPASGDVELHSFGWTVRVAAVDEGQLRIRHDALDRLDDLLGLRRVPRVDVVRGEVELACGLERRDRSSAVLHVAHVGPVLRIRRAPSF